MRYVPKTLAAAMLAGVLLRFGLDVFVVLPQQAGLVGIMLASYLLARRYLPLYAVPLTFFIGLGATAALGLFQAQHLAITFAQPLWMTPTFSVTSLIGVGIPLFIVSMASQNVPGLAVLRANGYTTPASPLIGFTGLAGLLLAPFGGFSFNLAAITAAMCMSKDADPDPKRRYLAAVCAGCFYVVTGVLGATVVSLFAAFPQALIVTIAGLALLGTIGNGLATALSEAKERDAAVITFLVTASGLSLFGLNSAFWGLALGMVTAALNHRKSP
jgi:benzoate membrane transport protein